MLYLDITNLLFMQNSQILPNNQQGVQAFDIENLQNNEPAQQTNLSKNVPLKAGAFFGVGNAVGGYLSNAILPKDKFEILQRALQSIVSQALSNGMMASLKLPFSEKTNIITDNVVNIGASTVGNISGILATNLAKEFSNKNFESDKVKQMTQDFALLSVFVFMQLSSKPYIKELCEKSETFRNISNKDFLKIKNISSKTINFFINSLSGAVGAYCSSQYMANENINNAVKTLTAGEVFSMGQNATKVLLTSLYNKCFKQERQR